MQRPLLEIGPHAVNFQSGGAKEPYGKAAVALIHWSAQSDGGRQTVLANLSVENRPPVDNIDDIFVDIPLLTHCFIRMR